MESGGSAAAGARSRRAHAKEYLRKHQFAPAGIADTPAAGLRLVVVIPSRDEPDLAATLDDLRRCEPPGCAAEAIVVLNASDNDPADVRRRHREAETAIASRDRRTSEEGDLRIRALRFDHLPARHAGVGLARKLGMDEAVARLLRAGCDDGIIACLDADCRVEENYLKSLVAHFDEHPNTPACSIHFEHPLQGPLDSRQYRAVTEYELYLRYYRHGLEFSGHPCAHYTVGSCMAVRADAYARQGGMNRRKGAEDFYFLNKLMLLGNFSELRDTTVSPSPRVSRRVPFGTGRAVAGAVSMPEATLEVYAPEIFDELKRLHEIVPALREEAQSALEGLPATLREFLVVHGVEPKLAEIRAHTATAEAFKGRFWRWFDGFRAMKFARFASETRYPRVPVAAAARALLERLGATVNDAPGGLDAAALLERYRRMDREGRGAPPECGKNQYLGKTPRL